MKKALFLVGILIGVLLFGASTARAATFIVPQGGTGVTSVTAGRLIYGAGSSPFQSVATSSVTVNAPLTSAGTPGYVVGGSGWTLDIDDIAAADLASADFGDFTCDGATCTIDANAVALGTDTTNNYVATIADDGQSTVTVNNSGSESAAITLRVIDVVCTGCLGATEIAGLGSDDISGLDISADTNLAVTWPIVLTDDTLSWGGLATTSAPTAGNLFYSNGTTGLVPVATSSVTINAPLTSAGTVGYVVGGSGWILDIDDIGVADLANADFGDFSCSGSTCTVDANAIALTTDTTGNYVESITGTANQITVTNGSGAEDLDSTLSLPAHVIFPGNFQYTNATGTNATTTGTLYVTGAFASTTKFFADGLVACNTGNMLTWSAGVFGCEDDSTSAGAADPFVWSENYGVINAATTTNPIWATLGINASSTSHFVNASTTQFQIGTDFITDLSTGLTIDAAGVVTVTDVTCTNCLTTTEVASADLATLATNVSDTDFGDVTVASGAWAVEDNSHAHDATTVSGLGTADISGLDISDDTNLAATWPVILSGDTLSFGGLSTSSPIAAASGLLYATGVNTLASVSTSSAISLSITGNAGTATALAGNGTNCSAGNYPLGVDAGGNVEDCTAAAAGGSGSVSTSTNEVANQVATFTSNSATPATIGGDTDFTFSGNLLQITQASSSRISVHSTAYFGGTATSTFSSTGALDLKTSLTFAGDVIDELVGTGLQLVSGDLTLNATGDWTGTIDGNNFAGGAIGAGELVYGGSAGSFSELAVPTAGFYLTFLSGIPTWSSTSTIIYSTEIDTLAELETVSGTTNIIIAADIDTLSELEGLMTATNILAETEIDGCSELLALLDDETGTCGGAVFSTAPTFVTNASSPLWFATAGGSVSAPPYSFTGDTNTGIWSPAADTISITTNGVEKFRSDSGYSAFGTTTPKIGQLTVGSSTAPQIMLTDNTAGTYLYALRAAGNNLYIATSTATATSTNPIMYFSGTGSTGLSIGTTTGQHRLTVHGIDNDTGVAELHIPAAQADVTAADIYALFTSTTGTEGTIAGTAVGGVIAYNTFTGSHWTTIDDKTDVKPGYLLVATGEKTDFGKDHLVKSALSCERASKAVYGVYGGTDPEGHDTVLSVGTGYMYVVNKGEDLEVGDLLMSSDSCGMAERQKRPLPWYLWLLSISFEEDDGLISNITAGKVMEPVYWEDGEESRMVSVVYLGG